MLLRFYDMQVMLDILCHDSGSWVCFYIIPLSGIRMYLSHEEQNKPRKSDKINLIVLLNFCRSAPKARKDAKLLLMAGILGIIAI